MKLNIFGDYHYTPISPCVDNDELAAQGHRLMFRHARNNSNAIQVFMAKQHELNAGWVIGLMVMPTHPNS